MEALSRGFCARVLTRCITAEDVASLHHDFPDVTVQVVDIQRYPAEGKPRAGVSRFYLALSDAESILWAVVPPFTTLEEQLSQFELDVGCCLALHDFRIVAAACGLNVVVPLSAAFSANPQSLIGQPWPGDDALFHLSDQCLLKANATTTTTTDAASQGGPQTAHEPSLLTEIVLQTIIDQPECVLAPWKLAVRVACKSTPTQLRQFPPSGATQAPSSAARAQKGMLRFIGVDRHGACICCVIWLPDAMDTTALDVGDCVLLTGGTVKWSEMGLPMELQFNSRGIEAVLPAARLPPTFPLFPRLLVGNLATSLKSVQSVRADSQVDEVVSVTGVIRHVQPVHHVNTKRGRVACATVTLEDAADPNITIEVTLWADAAETVRPPQDELWLFHYCTVREFRQQKTLSSRSTSLFCRLSSADEHPDRAASEDPAPSDALSFDRLEQLARVDGYTPVDGAGPNRPRASAAADISDSALAETRGTSPYHLLPAFRLSLELTHAAPTMPILVRLQDVVVTQLDNVEAHAPTDSTALPAVQVTFSDGLRCAVATTASDVIAAALFDDSALQSVRAAPAAVRREVCSQLWSELIGAPLLAWLLPCPFPKEADQGCALPLPCLLVHCRHADTSLCTASLLDSIDTFQNTEDGI